MKKMNWSEGILPLIIVIYGVAYVWQTYSLPWDAIFYPYALLGLMAMLLVLVGWAQLGGRAGGDQGPTESGHAAGLGGALPVNWEVIAGWFSKARKGNYVVLCTFSYPFIIQFLGFIFTTFLFLTVLFMVFKAFRLMFIIPISIFTTGGLSFLLRYVMNLNLPPFKFAELPFGF